MSKIVLSKEQTKNILTVIKGAAAVDQYRPVLTYAKVEYRGGKMTVTALDGYKMITSELEPLEAPAGICEFFLKPFTLPKGLERTEIESSKREVELTFVCKNGSQKLTIPQPADNFPQTDGLFPETEKNLSVTVDAALLYSVLYAFGNMGDRAVTISFKARNGGLDPTAPILLEHAGRDKAIVLTIRN